jgi:hypothetical protein
MALEPIGLAEGEILQLAAPTDIGERSCQRFGEIWNSEITHGSFSPSGPVKRGHYPKCEDAGGGGGLEWSISARGIENLRLANATPRSWTCAAES